MSYYSYLSHFIPVHITNRNPLPPPTHTPRAHTHTNTHIHTQYSLAGEVEVIAGVNDKAWGRPPITMEFQVSY
ncbi:hypothetical protein T492DRAFT_407746 [Pavlovales sp. CCMP2436]|nr:hypothetical protein T492DRAFT_407746 [Pavlovales sp. CCMP2436]